MGKYQPYPSYSERPSSLFACFPDHWTTSPLKYLGVFKGGGTPAKDQPAFWNGDIPWVSPKDMKVEVVVDSADRITAEGLAASATSIIDPGSVLFVVRSGILRHTIPVAITGKSVALNQDMKAFLPSSQIRADFVAFFIRGNQSQLLHVWRKEGATVESLEQAYIAETSIPVPPPDEQAQITAFLDHETAKIDRLIAKQERLIELLK